MLRAIFGAHGQLVVGAALMLASVAQTVYWLALAYPPGKVAIFIVSMEALAFAAFNQIGSALGYRATERVEQLVVENAEDVEVNG